MVKKYMVDLSAKEQEMLTDIIGSGTQRARKINHARILGGVYGSWPVRWSTLSMLAKYRTRRFGM